MTGNGPPFAVGAKVLLRHCAFGEPGTVLRIERSKLVVLWPDLDFLARHSPETLMLTAEIPVPCTSCIDNGPASGGQRKGKQR